MRITAEKVKTRDLKPGDLFSTGSDTYWEVTRLENHSIGERVYIRTEEPTPEDQSDEDIYRIVIHNG